MKTTARKKFLYSPARRLSGWGFGFDSFTEVKYAISIMEDFAFLRAGVSIYFHPGTLAVSEPVRKCFLRYTPDFLIRHKETNKAFLVEIKPRAFENHPQLALRKQVAENYIRWKKLDWQFRVVFDDEIILTAEQLKHYESARKMPSNAALRNWFSDYYHRVILSMGNHPSLLMGNKRMEFLMYGRRQLRFSPNW